MHRFPTATTGTTGTAALALLAALALAGCTGGDAAEPAPLGDPPSSEGCVWSSSGSTPFFILEPGFTLHLAEEGGDELDIVMTVEDQTRVVAGVETRVVTERESEDGDLVEVSRNYFAICGPRNDVFYFGEEVDDYEDGEVSGHGGAWLAGVDGAKPGIAMFGDPQVGMSAYMEYAPGAAVDHFEVVALDQTVETPAGTFTGAVKVRETNPLEPGKVEFKWHAPGVGLLVDEGARLVEHGIPGARSG